MRGPGETQLETDRRLIGNRIKQLKKKLDKQHNQKNLNRYSRKKGSNKLVALVGYTNAGKTSLFNILTKGGGGLGYKNNYSVTPGQSYYIRVGGGGGASHGAARKGGDGGDADGNAQDGTTGACDAGCSSNGVAGGNGTALRSTGASNTYTLNNNGSMVGGTKNSGDVS